MRNKYLLPIITVSILANLLLAWQVLAGSPDSPGAPNATSSYTLQDLYNRLTAGTAGSQSVFTEPSSAPGTGTMHSINEIMAVAPALDNTNGATLPQVLTGQTFWGLTGGQWGLRTGTMPNNGVGSTIVPTTTNQSVAAGYWSSANTVQGDTDLTAGNIVSGTAIFGVDGSAVTASGNATDGQVLTGTSFSNSSGAATGTMPNNGAVTLVPTTTNVAIAAGYHNGSGYAQGDTDLIAANIKSGVNLFGVDGTLTAGSTYNAGVPKTGQTTSYATGDDGDLERGVAWPSPRFTDNGNGTVTDNLTGLIWLRNANCFGTQTWANALTSANNLASGTCGLTDGSTAGVWRLPNVRELQSLVDYGRYNPALPSDYGTYFTAVQSFYYWSGSTYANDTSLAFFMSLNFGNVTNATKGSFGYVWPVRGGQ